MDEKSAARAGRSVVSVVIGCGLVGAVLGGVLLGAIGWHIDPPNSGKMSGLLFYLCLIPGVAVGGSSGLTAGILIAISKLSGPDRS